MAWMCSLVFSPEGEVAIWCGARVSRIALSGLIESILGGAPGEREDVQGRIFVRPRGETAGIGNEEIFYVVRLTEAGENGSAAVGPHAYSSDFVSDAAWHEMSELGMRRLRRGLAAGGVQDLFT